MNGRPLLYLLALTALTLATQHRKLHRLAGGHLRIINPDPDDSELMKADASGSREKKYKSDQDEKKTLSQQVADGKYGLIQKELFSKPSKRPGVLSYDDNPEVPKDNKSNLGGLNKDEIWLAENHLLVLRGGVYPPHEEKNENDAAWPPIDNFNAPLHQVKIPAYPKVPPPFPVQFVDDGPLQILGTNTSRTLNDTIPPPAGFAVPPPDGFQPDPYSPFAHPDPANVTAWQAALPVPVKPSGEYPEGVPFPPYLLNGTLPPYFASLPPGAVILPPPGNQTDLYDEDDPSIYYPPPYSFYYPKDNSSVVPPGPLVPGIILPPPPNFFAPLEEMTTTTRPQIKTTKIYRQRKPATTEPHPQIHPTTTPLPPTETTTTKKAFKVYPVHDAYYTNEIKPTIITTKRPKIVTVLPARQKNRTRQRTTKPQEQRKRPQVTVLRPVKPNAPMGEQENEISEKPFAEYGPPKSSIRDITTTTTTQASLKYYVTSNEIETNSVTAAPIKVRILPEQKSTVRPVKYYFYEEEPRSATTERTPAKQYYDVPEQYYVPANPTVPLRQTKPQYIFVSARPYNTQKPKFRYVQQPTKTDTYSIHIARLQNQINQYYTTPRPTYRPVPQSPKPVYQFSFQAANYQPQQNRFKPSRPDLNQDDQFRPLPKYSVQIQQAIEIIPTEQTPIYYQQNYQSSTERPTNYYTTARPNYAYDNRENDLTGYHQTVGTPRPISEYSFKVTPNPIYQGFYTKPDERYFDDNTKNYLTVFGKKITSSTSPIPNIEHITPKPNQQTLHQKPISLETDTIVNYVHPRPQINPDAEVIHVNGADKSTTDYPKVIRYTARPAGYIQRQKIPHREENPEIIKAVPVEVPVSTNDGQDGSYISYQLPGDDGAHFYFLTPQLAQRRDQGSGYYYSQAQSNGRTRRNNNIDEKR